MVLQKNPTLNLSLPYIIFLVSVLVCVRTISAVKTSIFVVKVSSEIFTLALKIKDKCYLNAAVLAESIEICNVV